MKILENAIKEWSSRKVKGHVNEASLPSEVREIKKMYGKEYDKILKRVTKEAQNKNITGHSWSTSFDGYNNWRKEIYIRFTGNGFNLGATARVITLSLNSDESDLIYNTEKKFRLYVSYCYNF